jgi:hypothetical protein
MARLELGGEPEAAADARRAFDADFTVHGPASRWLIARPSRCRRSGGWSRCRPVRRAGTGGQVFGRNADAGIGDRAADGDVAVLLAQHLGAQADLAALGEFDGVGQEVEQDLLDAHRIAAHRFRHGRVEFAADGQLLGLGALGDLLAGIEAELVQRKSVSSSSSLSASILEMSRMSLMMASR